MGIRNLTQRRNSKSQKRKKKMQKYLIVLIFVLAAHLLATNCAPINSEEDPENLQDLDEMYTCHKEPKKILQNHGSNQMSPKTNFTSCLQIVCENTSGRMSHQA